MESPSHPSVDNAPIESLRLAGYNPRMIDAAEMQKLVASLREFGFVQPVVARAEDREVIGGHQRIEAWTRYLVAGDDGVRGGVAHPDLVRAPLSLDEARKQTVPVVFLRGLGDKRTKVLNLALNRISGEWDYTRLARLFTDLDLPEADLDLTGFDVDEVDSVLRLMGVAGDDGSNDGRASDGDRDASIARKARRLIIDLATDDQARRCKEVLQRFGFTHPGDLAAAFVRIVEVAARHGDEAPAPPIARGGASARAKGRRGKKVAP